MPGPIAQSPAAGVFGYEVASDTNKNKNLLQQCVAALVANGKAVTLPPGFATPDVGLGKGGTPDDALKQLIKNIQTAMDVNSITYTPPTFTGVALNDGSSQLISKWGAALFAGLQAAGYLK
jgi:hypothetical protein